MCFEPFYSLPAQKSHVCNKHGRYVWDFIIKNKREKKANNYGVIGIREDGTPYAMPDGAGSSNVEHDADVRIYFSYIYILFLDFFITKLTINL
ncbi:unnamed protein product [Meloidogyne enterolobii]|uniref:Uncharacterized protein n=1 Tax=Meloidogyne enterolobii TaxID=390850 RepID=A0ACB0XXB6_MELEN